MASTVGAASDLGGFGVTVGGGGTGPSATTRREFFDETIPLGISRSGSTGGATSAGTSMTGSGADSGVASTAGSSAAAGADSTGASGATGSDGVASATTPPASLASSVVAVSGLEAAALVGGAFLLETTAAFFFGASGSGVSSSTGVSRTSPSRSALRRTRSAWASTMLEEWLLAPIPSAPHKSRVSALEIPSSRASS